MKSTFRTIAALTLLPVLAGPTLADSQAKPCGYSAPDGSIITILATNSSGGAEIEYTAPGKAKLECTYTADKYGDPSSGKVLCMNSDVAGPMTVEQDDLHFDGKVFSFKACMSSSSSE